MNVHEGFAKSCGCSAIHEPPASLFGLQTVSRNYRACPQWEPYQLYEIICKSQILRRTMVKCGGWPPDFFREYGRFFFHVCFKLNEQSLKSLFWFVKFNHAEVTVRIRIRTCWVACWIRRRTGKQRQGRFDHWHMFISPTPTSFRSTFFVHSIVLNQFRYHYLESRIRFILLNPT